MEKQAKCLRLDMEDLVGDLRLELEGKDCRVRELTSSVAEMREKMAEAEVISQTAAHRIGAELN